MGVAPLFTKALRAAVDDELAKVTSSRSADLGKLIIARRVTPQIKREFKRRAAIEPVIGHLKGHHRMGRNYLAHASGDAINAVLAAAGYNFRRLLDTLTRFLAEAKPKPEAAQGRILSRRPSTRSR